MVVSQCLLLQEEVYIINQRGREPHILRGGRSRPRRFLFNASEPAAEFRVPLESGGSRQEPASGMWTRACLHRPEKLGEAKVVLRVGGERQPNARARYLLPQATRQNSSN